MPNRVSLIRQKLRQLNMTQKQLSELTGVSERTVRSWLNDNGKLRITFQKFKIVMNLLEQRENEIKFDDNDYY